MLNDALHHPPLMPHLLIDGLNRLDDEPCLYLGDTVAILCKDGRSQDAGELFLLNHTLCAEHRIIAIEVVS